MAALVWLLGVVGLDAAAPEAEGLAFFESKIRPLLEKNCYECHSHGSRIKGGLTLDSRKGLLTGGDTGPAIVPGQPAESLLLRGCAPLGRRAPDAAEGRKTRCRPHR